MQTLRCDGVPRGLRHTARDSQREIAGPEGHIIGSQIARCSDHEVAGYVQFHIVVNGRQAIGRVDGSDGQRLSIHQAQRTIDVGCQCRDCIRLVESKVACSQQLQLTGRNDRPGRFRDTLGGGVQSDRSSDIQVFSGSGADGDSGSGINFERGRGDLRQQNLIRIGQDDVHSARGH